MADRRPDRDRELTRLLERLPREIAPRADLWPGIEAAISQDSTNTGLFGELPADVEPETDLWPGIETRIRRERKLLPFNRPARRQGYLSLAACLAVCGIVGIRGTEGIRGSFTTADVSDLLFPATADAYAANIRNTLRQQIAAVRRQRMQIEESLDRYPADPALQELWRITYEAELKLIDTAGRVLSTI
jgi:hypothetical protein